MNIIDNGRAVALVSAFVVVTFAAVVLGLYRFHHDHGEWTSDGAIYLRMALQDRGASPDEARREANAFMRTTAEARIPEAAGFYTDAPPQHYRDQFDLFRSRPLYPLVASALYPRLGPDALKAVSVAAYVAAVMLAYLVLLQLATPWLAALGALGLATAPPVLDVAALPLTDELALALWIATLGALLAYLRVRSAAWLLAAVAAAAVLTFVRPAIYLPFGVAVGALIAAPAGSPQRGVAARAAVAFALIGALFFAYTTLVHGPGVAQQLRWEYDWRTATGGAFAGHGFGTWWALTFAAALAEELVVETYRHNALFTLVLAAFGLAVARRTLIVPVVLGGAAATLVALVVNPVELARTVTLPLEPLVIVLATVALVALDTAVRERRVAVGDVDPRAGAGIGTSAYARVDRFAQRR